MFPIRGLALPALALSMLSVATDGRAHSLKDLERLLGDKEKYFQAVNEAAPDLAMQDADGRPVRLADPRGKVVVLHFIYAGCPDVCPLQPSGLRKCNPWSMRPRCGSMSVS